ncbi:hypothetical protein THRCLA_07933 [Thraustotheca clavata]|uniref:Uncharacterized protein n=1 Tax=Thraustotheca clavata TaxID=74557 RepID=A0A1V9ZBJ6_9STRA|nr:hypothetical protein THRCLA_07933 [Thraustotheca clavata]
MAPTPCTTGKKSKLVKKIQPNKANKSNDKAENTKNGKNVVKTVKKEEEKPKADAKMELDALFSNLKTKKKQKQAADEAELKRLDQERAEMQAYRKKLEKLENEHKAKNNDTSNPQPVRYDADGLPIYTEAALRINQGGDTADCPFDCWCCF